MPKTVFAVADTPMFVWGIAGTPTTVPMNGTNATGPDISNYNAATWGEDDFTQLDWWVTIGAIPEGVYWGIITLSIDS